ncbi:alpha/beta fold hydrolase [Streptomyces sp. NPDC056160]|uniref:alpha/beta fold hydrolase n=1 Tax=Streptomyces sp. NPDC056160 TaxID=3345731 RepID=UPI0035E37021
MSAHNTRRAVPVPGTASGTAPAPGGGTLYYEALGEPDGTPLVLAHGGMLDLTMWDELAPALARAGHRVVRYDQRGHGRSSSVTGDWSNHADLRALLAHLRLQNPVLIGLSGGARLIVDHAVDVPDDDPTAPSALVLAAPGLSGREFTDPYTLQHFGEQIAAVGAPDGAERYVEHFLRMWADGPYRVPADLDPALRERLRAGAAANVADHAGGLGAGRLIEANAAERLDRLRVRRLVIVGELDTTDIHTNARALGGRLVTVPGAGHTVNLEAPDRFERAILSFLGGRR